jgi:hypothetical protein
MVAPVPAQIPNSYLRPSPSPRVSSPRRTPNSVSLCLGGNPDSSVLCFDTLANCLRHNSFPLITIRVARGCGVHPHQIPPNLSAFNCQLSTSALSVSSLSPFRMNTCRTITKQTTLTPFRINTYAKPRGEGVPSQALPDHLAACIVALLGSWPVEANTTMLPKTEARPPMELYSLHLAGTLTQSRQITAQGVGCGCCVSYRLERL